MTELHDYYNHLMRSKAPDHQWVTYGFTGATMIFKRDWLCIVEMIIGNSYRWSITKIIYNMPGVSFEPISISDQLRFATVNAAREHCEMAIAAVIDKDGNFVPLSLPETIPDDMPIIVCEDIEP